MPWSIMSKATFPSEGEEELVLHVSRVSLAFGWEVPERRYRNGLLHNGLVMQR